MKRLVFIEVSDMINCLRFSRNSLSFLLKNFTYLNLFKRIAVLFSLTRFLSHYFKRQWIMLRHPLQFILKMKHNGMDINIVFEICLASNETKFKLKSLQEFEVNKLNL